MTDQQNKIAALLLNDDIADIKMALLIIESGVITTDDVLEMIQKYLHNLDIYTNDRCIGDYYYMTFDYYINKNTPSYQPTCFKYDECYGRIYINFSDNQLVFRIIESPYRFISVLDYIIHYIDDGCRISKVYIASLYTLLRANQNGARLVSFTKESMQ